MNSQKVKFVKFLCVFRRRRIRIEQVSGVSVQMTHQRHALARLRRGMQKTCDRRQRFSISDSKAFLTPGT
jgi:hypothetical protein